MLVVTSTTLDGDLATYSPHPCKPGRFQNALVTVLTVSSWEEHLMIDMPKDRQTAKTSKPAVLAIWPSAASCLIGGLVLWLECWLTCTIICSHMFWASLCFYTIWIDLLMLLIAELVQAGLKAASNNIYDLLTCSCWRCTVSWTAGSYTAAQLSFWHLVHLITNNFYLCREM